MKLYTYDNTSFIYKRFRILTAKRILLLFVTQILLGILLVFLLSHLFDTPKERRLKKDVSFLLYEYRNTNKKMYELEKQLQEMKDYDSIIFTSLFEMKDIPHSDFKPSVEIEQESDFKELVEQTHNRLLFIEKKMEDHKALLNIAYHNAREREEFLEHVPAIQPIYNKDLKRTASGWGYRIHPIYNVKKFHYGMDFSAATGTPVYSTGKGIIEFAGYTKKGYGNVVIVDHGYGYKTLYAHLSKILVKKKDPVERGTTIALVGNTGLSTGPHLHYEVFRNGKRVNPVNYYFNDLTPEQYRKIIEISESIQKSYD